MTTASRPVRLVSMESEQTIPAEQIKHARAILGHSQEEAARAIGIAGSTVSKWERGIQHPGMHLTRQAFRLYIERAAEKEASGGS